MTEQSFLLDEDTPETLPWQEEALCAQTDPEAFFPEKGGSTREANTDMLAGECCSTSTMPITPRAPTIPAGSARSPHVRTSLRCLSVLESATTMKITE